MINRKSIVKPLISKFLLNFIVLLIIGIELNSRILNYPFQVIFELIMTIYTTFRNGYHPVINVNEISRLFACGAMLNSCTNKFFTFHIDGFFSVHSSSKYVTCSQDSRFLILATLSLYNKWKINVNELKRRTQNIFFNI